MPRLLLVDENASIRRSAEILLGGTDMELVAVASAEEALEQVAAGADFQVALIHAFLPGPMDGWQLLTHFRNHPATARMPIALMAGVLKEIDPVQIAEAPIQGFLRKPIELGNLRDRLATLMAIPVPEPDSSPEAFETAPGRPLEEMLSLPETRAEEAPMERDEDLLILEIQDLYPDETVPAAPEEEPLPLGLEFEGAASEDSLELEELDLEALRSLTIDPGERMRSLGEPEPEPSPDWSQPTSSEMASEDDLRPTWEEVPAPVSQFLPDFPTESASDLLSELETSEGTVDLPDLGADLDLSLEPEPTLGDPEESASPMAPVFEEEIPVAEPTPAPAPTASLSVPAADAQALVRALVADPAALDALCRAVVAELGDRALKEIAWEIMPDLAEKLRK